MSVNIFGSVTQPRSLVEAIQNHGGFHNNISSSGLRLFLSESLFTDFIALTLRINRRHKHGRFTN